LMNDLGSTVMSVVANALENRRLRYLIAGGYNTVFGYGFFIVLYLLLKEQFHYMAIFLIAQFVAICNAFLTYKYCVFKTRGNIFTEFTRFNLVYGLATLFALFAMPLLVEVVGFEPVFSQTIIVVVRVHSQNMTFARRG